MRAGLAIRSLLVVLPLAYLGMAVLQSASFTSVACLTGLWMILADYRRPSTHSYLLTGIGSVVAVAIGSAPMPTWLTLVVITVVTGMLGAWRGFGGFASSAGVTFTSELLVGLGLRLAGNEPTMVVLGAAAGAALAAAVGIAFGSRERKVLRAIDAIVPTYLGILEGRRPDSDAEGASTTLMSSYVEAGDRPQAPTRSSIAMLHRLAALGRLGDLLVYGAAQEDQALRGACARRLAGGQQPVSYDGPDLMCHALAMTTEAAVAEAPMSRGELRRQIRARLRTDGMLFTQALFTATLYATLTALVLFVPVDRPHWVLLGAVSASYPYARHAAGLLRTMLVATVIAFAVILVVTPIANRFSPAWWLLFAAAVFVATAAPRSGFGKTVSQSAMTVISLALLAIGVGGLSGQDVEVRFEDVMAGGITALVVAFFLAPRHLRERLEAALSGMYSAAAHGLSDPDHLLEECRAQFLRCVDAMESIRGTKAITTPHLVSWLDASRNIVQLVIAAGVATTAGVDADTQNVAAAGECRRRAGELNQDANISVYYPPPATGVAESQLRRTYDLLFEAQRRELADLTPLLPLRYFNRP